jgi:hypothetical protein
LNHHTSLYIFMMLSLTCVECWECWSSICRDVRWPWWDSIMWLSMVWNGGEGCDLHGLCLVMLESAKDRVLGVYTPGQQVPPWVQYGTVCLQIRDVVGSVPCSDEWEISIVTRPGPHSARGAVVLQLLQETLAMLWYYVLPWQSLAYDPM